ncbi:hypothetical protein DCO58_00255 [Helicobacter saguini]|uniref:Beta-lactamase n=1 Tax=Helicobacter saguini TaxID=1548018 RepID=A0A347VQS7_9HELI|nr:SEL1-like repeat protein [Helicobacter saguini]MWV63175.1 hypothetical protein [Helicobacter saguini]MWV66155.1 hypothetical protein [Helicobacter saguini]MWV68504.1 hypothetical protein [Helicobacter saguini]MWV71941.1 hypothetical protein [Helicobacter saguini]TLD95951.1 hypothetical protein LS64_000900 [Helicobacter saguini]
MFSNVGLDSKIYRIFFVVFCFMGFAGVLNAIDPVTERFIAKYDRECNEKKAESCATLGQLYTYGDEKAGIKPSEQKMVLYYTKACDMVIFMRFVLN